MSFTKLNIMGETFYTTRLFKLYNNSIFSPDFILKMPQEYKMAGVRHTKVILSKKSMFIELLSMTSLV